MNTKPIYQELASLVLARKNCIASGNHDWNRNHTQKIHDICKQHMPSGSGIDCGTKIDLDSSHADKLVFQVEFHHMNDNGMYDGWTTHQVIVTPSLAFGFTLKITGRDRNQIKDYLSETYHYALEQHIA